MSKLSYTSSGDGVPLVLIHGFCESRKLWANFSAMLSVKYHVINVDLPGFGKSPLSVEKPSITYFAEEINGLLEDLKIEKCLMVGHSLGGYVSLAFASLYAQKLIGLGLFHSTAFSDSEEKKNTRVKAAAFIRENGTAKFVSSLFPGLFSPHTREKFKNEIQYFINAAENLDKEVVAKTMEAMRDRPDRRDVLKELDIPVLFVIGKDDGSVPMDQSLKECHLPKESIVHILGNVGHMGMIEEKNKTLEILSRFTNYCINRP
ncbi:alpha/beta fold hydrolase [Flexithrix dorotheae]|uniref:alpha/beta fold hydrolase n=1 Tax=Flexithrix dorotheae TaxID=70993 RepID=UPI00036A68E8|nr:alpha/beta hydrolase [Flexithrix dorotheae]